MNPKERYLISLVKKRSKSFLVALIILGAKATETEVLKQYDIRKLNRSNRVKGLT